MTEKGARWFTEPSFSLDETVQGRRASRVNAMIDHISLAVADLAKSTAFYEAVLAPLGLAKLVARDGASTGIRQALSRILAECAPPASSPDPTARISACAHPARTRCANSTRSRWPLGGRDAGAPGPRQAAFTTYFGAFILDPDGNKIEAVNFPR